MTTQTWQPMHTVPRNGRWLGRHSDGEINICMIENGIPVVINNGDYDGGDYGQNYKTTEHDEWSHLKPLTGWQPLPTP